MPVGQLAIWCLILVVIVTVEGAGNSVRGLTTEINTLLVVTLDPVSVTTTLYTTVNFTCEGNGDILNWLIESSTLTDSIKKQREITVFNLGNLSSVLLITALPINDGISVACHIVSIDPFDQVTSNCGLNIRG